MLFGLAGYATDSNFARDSADNCDRRSESTGEVDTACEELRDRASEFTVYAVSNKLYTFSCIPSCITGVVWSIHSDYWRSSCLGDYLSGSWLQQSFASTQRRK